MELWKGLHNGCIGFYAKGFGGRNHCKFGLRIRGASEDEGSVLGPCRDGILEQGPWLCHVLITIKRGVHPPCTAVP